MSRSVTDKDSEEMIAIKDEIEAMRKAVDEKFSYRREVWLRAWCAVAGSGNCTQIAAAHEWADECLEAFDKRFS